MSHTDDIVREYYEADSAYRLAVARAMARDEWMALPPDVREARAVLEVQVEQKRFSEAKIAFEQERADRHERWIAAHEDIYGVWSAAKR